MYEGTILDLLFHIILKVQNPELDVALPLWPCQQQLVGEVITMWDFA